MPTRHIIPFLAFKQNRSGATTVEMAMVAPFVFALLFGAVEFARMTMIRQALTNASREGARHATLLNTTDRAAVDELTRKHLRGVIKDQDDVEIVRVTVSPTDLTSTRSGDEVTVSVEVDCANVSWLPAFFFAGAEIHATSSMSRE